MEGFAELAKIFKILIIGAIGLVAFIVCLLIIRERKK